MLPKVVFVTVPIIGFRNNRSLKDDIVRELHYPGLMQETDPYRMWERNVLVRNVNQ